MYHWAWPRFATEDSFFFRGRNSWEQLNPISNFDQSSTFDRSPYRGTQQTPCPDDSGGTDSTLTVGGSQRLQSPEPEGLWGLPPGPGDPLCTGKLRLRGDIWLLMIHQYHWARTVHHQPASIQNY